MTQHPTQDSQSELRNAIEAYKRYPYGTKEYPHITGIELLEVVEAYVTTRVKEAERLRLDALYWMYTQYCSKEGHLFMGAGEEASSILEDAGYIVVDGTGRVTKDNGDSQEQKIKALTTTTNGKFCKEAEL